MADKVEETKERVTITRKTISADDSEETTFGDVDEAKISGVFSKLLKMNSPEAIFIIFGCLGARLRNHPHYQLNSMILNSVVAQKSTVFSQTCSVYFCTV